MCVCVCEQSGSRVGKLVYALLLYRGNLPTSSMGHLAVFGDVFVWQNWMGKWEISDAAKHLTMQRTPPHNKELSILTCPHTVEKP